MGRPKKGFLSFGGGALNDLSIKSSSALAVQKTITWKLLGNLKKIAPIFFAIFAVFASRGDERAIFSI
jgi:hypothetical protein